MSKSKGNVIDPLELTDQYGADALRFTLTAMAAQGRDVKMSTERVEGYRNFATKLWNAARYCEMNGCLPDHSFDPAGARYVPNRWIISEVVKARQAIDTAIESYRFNEAANTIYHFTWGTFCDWYLEFTKPVLADENSEADDGRAAETRAATGWVLDQILSLLNPFMPFITEELYQNIASRDESLLHADWPAYGGELVGESAVSEMDWLMRLITEIRSVRSDMNVPAGAKIALLVKGASDETRRRLADYDEIIRRMARLDSISPADSVPAGSIQTVVDEATLILPIADIIDLDKERARLQKEIERLQTDIGKIEKKLANENFIAKAPQEVVDEQRRRKEDAQSALNKLGRALNQLKAG